MDQRRRHGVAAVRPPDDGDVTINVCLDPVDFLRNEPSLSAEGFANLTTLTRLHPKSASFQEI